MLSYNSLTYVQDMKIGHYSEYTKTSFSKTDVLFCLDSL